MDNSYNASTDTFGLPATLPDFSGLHVVVIGDVMLDRTVSGSTERVSPEAPVPVVAFEGERNTPGGAANVALGVAALGARCTLLGLVGEDAEADTLERLCAEAGVQVDFIRVPGVPTTLKMRMQSRGQQLLRIDREAAMPAAAAKQLADRLEARLAHADALLVSDYDKGAIATPATVLAAARQHDIPVVVDPKHKPLASWRGATVVKPNRAEFERLTMAGGGPTVGLAARVAAARRQTGIDNLRRWPIWRGRKRWGTSVPWPLAGHAWRRGCVRPAQPRAGLWTSTRWRSGCRLRARAASAWCSPTAASICCMPGMSAICSRPPRSVTA